MKNQLTTDIRKKQLSILGIRGIPACHGGFETFAEKLAIYLTSKGWQITVYCQQDQQKATITEDSWCGVRRIHIPTKRGGPIGTMEFDWKSILHASKERPPLVLTLGYNTASFTLPFRLLGIPQVINMDGIEWKRNKWRPHEKFWLWLNERIGCLLGNHLIADHPEIGNHLTTRVRSSKITMIPYGASEITEADPAPLALLGVQPYQFTTIIARPERENSILEIVRAFSRTKRNHKLLVLGNYSRENSFHREVLDSASDEVIFPGAIYETETIKALRKYSALYIHGHTVGGTNPSLVEAMGAGSAILAHGNDFNKWVVSDGAHYFTSEEECESQLTKLLAPTFPLDELRRNSYQRFIEGFTWPTILSAYEHLLMKWHRVDHIKEARRAHTINQGHQRLEPNPEPVQNE